MSSQKLVELQKLVRYAGPSLAIEQGMPQVVRWKPFHDIIPSLHPQNNAQHMLSVMFMATTMCAELSRYGHFDAGAVLGAFAVHDLGEGELLRDLVADRKSDAEDLNEFLAFRSLISGLNADACLSMETSFLLQSAAKNPECFPADARETMSLIQRCRPREILIFDAIQRFAYLMCPIQHWQQTGTVEFLIRVVRRQIAHYDRFAAELPGFAELYWTPSFRTEMLGLIAEHEGQFVGGL